MVNIYGSFPSGVWGRDADGRLVRTQWGTQEDELFGYNGQGVAAHERADVVAQNNINNFLDPTATGTFELLTRETAYKIDNTLNWARNNTSEQFSLNYTGFYLDGTNSTGGANGSTGSTGSTGSSTGNTSGSSISPSYSTGGTLTPWSTVPVWGFGSAPGSGSVNNGNNGNNGDNGDIVANNNSTDYQSTFNSRLKLIQQYCDKYGNTVDIDKLKQKFSENPEEAVKDCDDIINNKFTQSRVSKLVKGQYQAKLDAQLENGKAISDSWVKTAISSNTTSTPNYDSSVNKNNVLDVIGTFMTQQEVKDGKVSLENVFDQPDTAKALMNAIKGKANEMLARKDVDKETKESISTKLADLVDYVDNFEEKYGDEFVKSPFEGSNTRRTAVNKYTELFYELRNIQAKQNDENAPEYYGLPEDTGITMDLYTKRANEEKDAYSHRRKLSTNI